MSEFHVKVIRIGSMRKHDNADTLSITQVWDYPVIVRTGEFKEGDLAVYVPVDSIVPADDPRWAFLNGSTRIKAKRLRGVFSMGLLTTADPTWKEGDDVLELLRIKKYEPPEPLIIGGEDEHDPGFMPVYTDIEGLRRWSDVLIPGEEVSITEKIHGANGRWIYQDGRLWCASHRNWKKENPDIIWWKAAKAAGLFELLKNYPDFGFYGEVFGQVQDLKYGAGKNELKIAFFDVINIKTRKYLDWNDTLSVLKGFPIVPILYQGPWKPELRSLAEGQSTWPNAGCVREGIVIKPVKERFDERIGRVILKLHGEGYLTRKEK